MKTSDKTPSSPKGFKLTVTRIIQAPVDMVFRAWTEPEQLRHWFSPVDVECKSLSADIKTGGSFRIHMVSKKGDHIATGKYLEIIPNQRLQFSWTWESYAMPDSVVTIDLEDLGSSTRLTLRHEGLPDQEDAEQHTEGWTSIVEKYVSLLETHKATV